jgi:membrane protein YqaA with SNARE-associated domain
MHASFHHLLHFLLQYGVFGLLAVVIADDSFLFLPVGGDLLAVILIARNHALLVPCILAGSSGSVIGVFFLDLVCRKSGEAGLKRFVKPRLQEYLKRQIEKRAALALIVSCLAPPPFPFGAAIAVASALQYPRPRLLTVVFFARIARFALVGWCAIYFGRHILQIADSSGFLWFMGGFIAICVAGSTVSIVQWVRAGK